MKQKIVIKVSMNDAKRRSKAITIAVGVPGVDSVAIIGEAKDQLQIIGDGIDSTELVVLLRKKLGHADFVTVDEVKAEVSPAVEASTSNTAEGSSSCHEWHYVEVRDSNPSCTIL